MSKSSVPCKRAMRMNGVTQRREISQRDRLDARQRLQTHEHLFVKLDALRSGIAHWLQIKARKKHVAGIEPRIGILCFLLAAD